jgi:hypothetical protein
VKTIKTSLILSCLALPVLSFAASDAVKTDAASTASPEASHESDTQHMQRAAQNPLTAAVSIPFQNNTNLNIGPSNQTQNIMNFQPVVPFELNDDWNVITRMIMPITTQPGFITGNGTHTGVGNTLLTAYVSPNEMFGGVFGWGVSPIVLVPASDTDMGTKEWGGGLSAVGMYVSGEWVVGGILNQIWAGAGDNSPQVNSTTFQYIVNYNFPSGWYLTTNPINTYNKRAAPGDRWNVPLGGGVGKVFKIKGQAINASMKVYKNIVKPSGNSSDISIQTQLVFLIPNK